MKLIRLNSFLYLFCILSVFASCVQKPDSSVEDWNCLLYTSDAADE